MHELEGLDEFNGEDAESCKAVIYVWYVYPFGFVNVFDDPFGVAGFVDAVDFFVEETFAFFVGAYPVTI